ncbi:unnamed protein product [Peniophora sp. CBMAI 1063]|nr:unnamed protein product [Peniophora sp. CBMAI 1063]
MSMEESISLEETNKIRISLGLKPLTDDAAPADDKDKQAEDNYAREREREVQNKEKKKVQDRIAKLRNQRQLNASLQGTTLGDADPSLDAEDAKKWVKKAKKRERELAKKRQAELESMEKAIQEEYTEKDLEGLKVSHDFDGLDEGEARILTLKDSRILDNEEDELQNVEMAEEERTKERNDLKIKKKDYTGYDDDEFGDGRAGMKKSLLAKYDDFLEGPKESGFRLGASAVAEARSVEERKKEEMAAASVNKSLLSIDYSKGLEISDYLQKGDVGFKKPKKKSKRSTRKAEAIDEEAPATANGDGMDVDIVPIARERNLDANFVDDDDLQAALARTRRAKMKAKKLTPEEIARKIAEERAQSTPNGDAIDVDAEPDEKGGLVIDDTSEFVRAINYEPVVVKKEVREQSAVPAPSAAAPPPQPSQVTDEPMEGVEVAVKEEDEEEDEGAILNAIESALNEQEAEDRAKANAGGEVEVGTSAEQTFGSGLGSTVNILRQQGLLAPPTADLRERERIQRERDLWLADQRRRVAERELERLRARGAPKDQAQREYENRVREQQEARAAAEAFRHYKPDVNIVYHDEFGRELTPKEAWKALSHRFHGKGSGKMKTEKRLKKIAEEKKQQAMLSSDTPTGMSAAFAARQEKTGQAHFVLSVGNRGTVPQAEGYLDPGPLVKKGGKTEKKKERKDKAGKNAGGIQTLDGGFMTVPAPVSAVATATATPSPNASPAPRAGFSRIASFTAENSPSGPGTPAPSDRSKVAFGFGTKRKAGEEAAGTPPPKSARV